MPSNMADPYVFTQSGAAADALQRPLRSRFQARLSAVLGPPREKTGWLAETEWTCCMVCFSLHVILASVPYGREKGA
jgi:hypothetical protein